MYDNLLDKMYILAHDKRFPLSLMVELLTKCNEKCIHCYIPHHDCDGLSTLELKNVISQFREIGGLNLSLTGGEIFLRNDIFDIIEYARSLFLRVFLLTNGTLITDECAKRLSELHIAELSVSVYSLNETDHDKITGVRGSLRKTLLGIDAAKRYNIPVTIKTPLMKINKFAYKELDDFCVSNKFNYLASPIIFSKSNGDPFPKSLTIDPEYLRTVVKDVEKYKTNSRLGNFPEACGSLKYTLAVDAYGNITPCNSFNYVVGNVRTTSLQDVWNSDKLLKIQNIMKADLRECTNCSWRKKCRRCPGLAYLEEKDYYACSSIAKTMCSFLI